jgi:hypothetical protein
MNNRRYRDAVSHRPFFIIRRLSFDIRCSMFDVQDSGRGCTPSWATKESLCPAIIGKAHPTTSVTRHL